MVTIMGFFLKSLFVSGILFLNYWIVLRNKQLHQYNRFYLLLALVMPVLLPVFNIKLYIFRQYVPASLNSFATEIFLKNAVQSQALFTLKCIAFAIVIIVCLVMLFIVLSQVVGIYKIKNNHIIKKMDGYNLIETDLKQAPFCFLNNLFWRKSISMDDDNGKKIFAHELAHIQERHTYDKMFSQIMLCFFWINPFYWFIQRELSVIHEFIADSKSIKDGDTESFANMLLHSYNVGRHLNPSHLFFHSSIKRRLTMIATSKNTRYSCLRRVLVVPITLLVFVMFSCTKTSSKTTLAGTENPFAKRDSTVMAYIQVIKEDGTIVSVPIGRYIEKLINIQRKAKPNYKTITANITFRKKDGTFGNSAELVTYAVSVPQIAR